LYLPSNIEIGPPNPNPASKAAIAPLRAAIPELTEEDYPVFECVGGGRSFHNNMKFDEIYNQALWDKIKQYED